MRIVWVIPFIKLAVIRVSDYYYYYFLPPQRKVICDVSSEAVFCGSLICLKYLRIIVLL